MVNPKVIVCKVCKRKFRSLASLADHERDSHSSRAAPVVVGRRRPRRRNKGGAFGIGMRPVVLSGVDLLDNVMVPPKTMPGTNLVAFSLTPMSWTGSRLKQVSTSWARWRPLKLELRVMAGGSAMTFGSLAVGWTPAVADHTDDSASAHLHRVLACKPNMIVPLNGTGSFSIPVETSRRWYLKFGMHEETTHGMILVCPSAATGGYDGNVTLTLSVSWTVEFEGDELSDTGGSAGQTIMPDTGYDHLFTTSDRSWVNDYLTFKNVEGGSMVPFSSSKFGVVYGLVPGNNVTVFQSDGREVPVRYFSRVVTYDTPGLTMHASFSDAENYQRTGILTYCLRYYKASSYARPGRPTLVAMDSDYPDRLVEENRALKARIAQLENPLNLVSDEAALVQLAALFRSITIRPSGSTRDPVTVRNYRQADVDEEEGSASSSVDVLTSSQG